MRNDATENRLFNKGKVMGKIMVVIGGKNGRVILKPANMSGLIWGKILRIYANYRVKACFQCKF